MKGQVKAQNPASEAARIMQAERKNRRGGRPVVVRQCLGCGSLFSAAAMRKHKPKCPKGAKLRARP